MATDFIPNYQANLPNLTDSYWNAAYWNFDYDVFGALHASTGDILDSIFPDPGTYDGFSLNPNDLLDFDESNFDFDTIVRSNTGPLVYSVFAIFFALVLLALGIGWMIYPICCKCGKKKKKVSVDEQYVPYRFGLSTALDENDIRQPIPKPKSKSKLSRTTIQLILGGSLLSVMVVYFAFLVGLFVTNGQLNTAINELNREMDSYLEDADTFITVTKAQVDAVLIHSYNNLSVQVNLIGGCAPTGTPRSVESRLGPLLSQVYDSVGEIMSSLDSKHIPPLVQSLFTKVESLKNLESTLEFRTDPPLSSLCGRVNEVRETLIASAKELNVALDDIPIQETRNSLEDIEDEFEIGAAAIFYSVMTLNIILLMIFITISIGTILHFLAPKKRVGGISLNCGLFTVFILGWIIWLFSVGIFIISGILVTVVPGAFYNIANNGSLVNPDALNTRADAGYRLPPVPDILGACRRHEGAYTVFHLRPVFDTNELDNLTELLVPDGALATRVVGVELSEGKVEINMRQLEVELKKMGVRQTSIQKMTDSFNQLRTVTDSIDSDAIKMERQVQTYVDFAKETIENDIGTCKPLWDVLESTIHTFSYKLGSPIGVYWFSLTLMLFLLFPTVIIAVIFLRH